MKHSSRFWLLLKPDSKEIYQVYTYAFFKGLIALSIPLGIQSIINLIQGGTVSTSWILLSILIALAVGINGYMQLMQIRIMENIQQNLFSRAAFNFTFRIPRIKLEAIQEYYAPELMNRFFEVLSIQKSLAKIIIDFSTAILQILFGLILLSLYHNFFILFSLTLIIMVYAIIKFTGKRALESSLEESKFKYKVLSWLEELARAKDSFKLAGYTDLPELKTDERVVGYLESREKHYKVLRLQFILLLVFKITVALTLLIVGGLLVINQQMNIGQFVAAEIVILLVIESAEKIILSLESVYDIFTSLEKIGQVSEFELEDTESDDNRLELQHNMPITLEIKNLSFGYPGTQSTILNNLSYTFERGKKYCISGDNGSGKSTLLHILSGLYAPTNGTVVFNGHPLDSYQKESLYESIGFGLKEETIFEGTLLENITLGRNYIDQSQVEAVLHKVFLNEFVKSHELGIYMPIQPLGRKLPRSVIQKILIARSIVSNPTLLMIEINLESIEPNEKKTIIDHLMNSNSWTLIIISNDSYVIDRSDSNIKMHAGSMI
jgi:ABC-type bacteriocin/lantibiotic exporter with double-glycine peptidase domain